MLFHTREFWVFFAIVLALFYSTPLRVGKLILLAASYYFYMCWDWRFAFLIFGSTVLDYVLGLAIATGTKRRKRVILVFSIMANLGVLGFFKYYNFFSSSMAALCGMPEDAVILQIVLPVGISFYTFKSMSYTIDVYKGWLAPVRNFLDYALFVVFFPELVAGPIVRADVFFPQLFNWQRPSAQDVQRSIFLIILGLVKKMVFADHFALVADEYFGHIADHPGTLAAWCGVFAFAMQIYFDFSGYTDIARGCAKLLGIQFPLNFARPYLSTNITEFWKRWHISLSEWLRDYLYIPLGGNRHGSFATSRNLMITMLLGGLWHGASWNFVLWGGYQGLLLLLHKQFVQRIRGTQLDRALSVRALVPVKVAVTMAFVLVGWVFFRAATLHDTGLILGQMFAPHVTRAGLLVTAWTVTLIGVSSLIAMLEEQYRWIERLALAPSWCRVAAYVVLFFCLELLSVTGQKIPFIYFQF